MNRMILKFSVIVLLMIAANGSFAQVIENNSSVINQRKSNDILGLKMRPEVQLIVAEIERRTRKKVYADFVRQDAFILASSYIGEKDGVPYLLVDYKYENGDAKKLEAIITHEVLHLRLTASGYPAFIFSESVNMVKGRAIDTEQDNINDLRSLIEHQIFKAEMQKFDLYRHINLAGDTVKSARKNKSKEDGQTEAINYARAILEYQNATDVEEVRKAYAANNWTRSLNEGKAIAEIISSSNPKTALDSQNVFLKCLSVLYPLPNPKYAFKLTPDPKIKTFKQMIVSISVKNTARKTSAKRS